MPEEGLRFDRTWLCSVLSLDIVNYSSQSVARQLAWKDLLTQALKEVLRPVVADDRVVLDTGDGAAVCFLGDPETALRCAMTLRDKVLAGQTPGRETPALRVGINLGPIRLIHDVNGNLNAIGDGINVSQRVMSFAGTNQILVSRSYFDVVSWLSEDLKQLFQFGDIRHDKHGREHAVYVVRASGPAPVTSRPASRMAFEPADLAAIGACLAECVGPIAGPLVTGASKTASTLAALCDALAETAVPEKERGAFLTCCRQRLGPSLKLEKKAGPAPTELAQANWDAVLLNQLKEELAQEIGVIAKVIVDRAARRATTTAELFELLAGEIPSEPKRKAFLARKGGTATHVGHAVE